MSWLETLADDEMCSCFLEQLEQMRTDDCVVGGIAASALARFHRVTRVWSLVTGDAVHRMIGQEADNPYRICTFCIGREDDVERTTVCVGFVRRVLNGAYCGVPFNRLARAQLDVGHGLEVFIGCAALRKERRLAKSILSIWSAASVAAVACVLSVMPSSQAVSLNW